MDVDCAEILLVDDDRAALEVAARVLARAGYRVARASNGMQALQQARVTRPKLMLLDVMLPDISGLEVLRRLKVDDGLTPIAVVMLSSAAAAPSDQALGLDDGAEGYILRPIANQELLARVRMHLRAAELRQELRASESRFRDLIAHQADAVLVVDASGDIRFVNRQAELLFGRISTELVGAQFGVPLEREGNREIEIARTEPPARIAEMRVAATQWEGRPAWITSLRDVTERRRFEIALQTAESSQRTLAVQLAAERASLLTAQAVAKVGSWETDLQTWQVTWSEQTHRIFETDPASFSPTHQKFLQTVYPEDREAVDAALLASLAMEGSQVIEHRLLLPDGRIKFVEERWQVFRSNEGKPHHAVGTCRDITERKLVEQERQELLEREQAARRDADAASIYYRSLFESAPGCYLVVESANYRVVAVSEAYLTATRVSRERIAGQALFNWFADASAEQVSDSVNILHESFERIKATGLADVLPVQRYPIHRQVADGGGLEDRFWSVVNSPVPGPDGLLAFIIHRVEDVTAYLQQQERGGAGEHGWHALRHWREQAEADIVLRGRELANANGQLRQSQTMLRMASKLSRIGAWSVELGSQVVFWSEEMCQLAEVPAGYSPGLDQAMEFFSNASRAAIGRAFEDCARLGTAYDIETDFLTTSGRWLQARCIGEAVRDAGGRIIRVQGAFQDVSEQKKGQRALLESLQRFRDLTDSMPMIVWAALPDGTVDLVTQSMSDYTGLPCEEILTAGWAALVHADDLQQAAQSWLTCVATGAPYAAECRIRGRDGSFRWHLARAVAVREPHGAIVRWYGSATDIHEHKLLEVRSRQLAHRLTTTLESITDAFFTVDREWQFTYLNSEAERLLQRSRDSLLGQNIWREFPQALGSVFEREYRHAVAETKTVEFEAHFAPLDLWVDVHAYPSSEGLAVYFRDMSRQRQADAQLRLLETAVARLNDIVLITEAEPFDEPGPRIVFVNDAFERRTGYSREEVIGKTPRILQGPGTSRKTLDTIYAALSQWKPVRAELLNYTKAGQEFWLELDIVPLADAHGVYTHWVAVERDISERHALEHQLRQAQRLESIGQLTGGMAHDFNNLLTVILGNAEMLSEQLPSDHLEHTLAGMIVDAAERGAELTQRLLAFARRQALEPRVVDINQHITGITGMLRRILGEHVEIVSSPQQDLWPALVDPAQFESALLNLCINARDAMPGGGHLTIETSNAMLDAEFARQRLDLAPGDYILVSVSDSGCGMSSEVLSRVFEPFYTTKEKGKGTGLGMSMVHGFIKQSGGHVSVYSEVGEGTTVKMYMPRAVNAGPQTEERRETVMQGGHETILLVEDDNLVRRFAHDQLVALGYAVLEAASGPQALQVLAQRGDIDLLLTDMVMPGGMNGRELAQAAQRRHPTLRVLYTSGYTGDAIVQQGRLDNGAIFLSKPYRRADLARNVRRALQADAGVPDPAVDDGASRPVSSEMPPA